MYFVKTNFRQASRIARAYGLIARPNGALASEIAKKTGYNASSVRRCISQLRQRGIKIYSITCIEISGYQNLSETRYFILTQ